jgi:hypothetical protein
MSVSITVSLTGVVSITDNQVGSVAQNVPVLVSFTGSVYEYYPAFTAATGGAAVTLPISPVQFVYLKNTSTTIAVNVTWTKNGGASAGVVTLDPGAGIVLCENGASNGITALTLTAASSTVPVQMVLAG